MYASTSLSLAISYSSLISAKDASLWMLECIIRLSVARRSLYASQLVFSFTSLSSSDLRVGRSVVQCSYITVSTAIVSSWACCIYLSLLPCWQHLGRASSRLG
jgi:hypothetical protein